MTARAEQLVLVPREDVALRLFAFPHAGGNAQFFADWAVGLPDDLEIVSFALPGRGRLINLAPYEDWAALIADLADLVCAQDDGAPFTFFGHSFGALVAFAVCQELARGHRRTPAALFLSAHRAPHLPATERMHALPEPELVDRVRRWGLVSDEHLADEELLRLVLPPLRSDLKLDETYQGRTERTSVPTVVYGGAADRSVSSAGLQAWEEHVEPAAFHGVELLPGGHFYPVTDRAALLASIAGHLDLVRMAAGPSTAIEGPAYRADQRSVWDRFTEQVAAVPEAPALIERDRHWNYRELHACAASLATELTGLGLGRGDVVGLLLPHSAEYCISLLSCFGLGLPACLLEKNWPASLLEQFLANAEVAAVVTVPELVALLPAGFRTPDRLLVLTPDRWHPLPEVEPAMAFPPVPPTDVALISMTSGTSGVPKAVLNTHLGCLYCFDARYERYPYSESSRDGLNVFFGWECLRPLLQGKPAVVIPDDCIFDPVRLVDVLAEHRITRIVVPPSLFESVLDHPVAGRSLAERLGQLEVIFLMGEVVPRRMVEKAAALLPPGTRLVNAYSTWESLDVSFADLLPSDPPPDRPSRSQFAPVGRILAGSAAVLLNEHGEPVPYGGVGELYFASPGVATGYLNDPAKTAERFVRCPAALADTEFAGETFYRTGDRARFGAGGEIEILGRTGDVVKVRGFKVSLRSVERVLAEQPGVGRVIVRPLPDERTGQPTGLVAYVLGEAARPSEALLGRLRQKGRRELPEYARPRHLIALDELPISQSDSRKLDLSALPAPPAEQRPAEGPTTALSTVEQRIALAWRQTLGVEVRSPDDNFFDLGGDSLSAARLSGELAGRFGIALPVIDIFQYSTVREMAAHCSGGQPAAEARRPRPATADTRLAIVGMAGRFPGAPDLTAFWQNLLDGVDSLSTFSPELLRAKQLGADVLADPGWVPVGQVLADADKFDAEFWGIGQREALLMDPQHRVFLEVAWSALEQAGYARAGNPYRRRTGVFAACGIDGYLVHHLDGGGLKQPLDPAAIFLTEIGNEKDYLATRVAYGLNLGGPALTVTSACSSALVAVAQAAQSIVSGQCDMAIAGASAITFPNLGYRYADGLVGSLDGTVRPFDEEASGTLFGDSVGAVVLKRLDDALADGDHVWAVLTGFGISNDGRQKAGYTAPSALAQSQCISDALAMAGIAAEQLSYVECHATATHLGDAIEVKGLLDAFTEHRRGEEFSTGSCALGSVKGNIGHANCAAGITGLIKTVLCLHHRTLVPTVHYRTLNPKLVDYIDCAGSPFTIQQTRGDWRVADPAGQLPRRAGVSSFGIGGTNAHLIVEEAPPVEPAAEQVAELQLVTVSARTELAFRRTALTLADFMQELPKGAAAAAVRTLQTRRAAHPLRAAAVVAAGAGVGELRELADRLPRQSRDGGAGVVFCFSGQGSQTAGMARGLFRGRADGGRFRRHFEAACASLADHLPTNPIAELLEADETSVRRPVLTQCGLFAVEYAIANSLLELGIRPVAVAGHSIGEYAAAVTAGLLTLDEAAGLVAARALATEQLPSPGGMLGVVGDEQELAAWLAGRTDVWLAAENAPQRLVLAGSTTALAAAQAELPLRGLRCRPVPVSHPFHTPLLQPVAERIATAAADLTARVPELPIASNLTGDWFEPGHRPADYWPAHLTSKVRWRDDLDALLRWQPDVVLEVGPGNTLTSFARKAIAGRTEPAPLLLPMLANARHSSAEEAGDDEADYLRALGELWSAGADLDFDALHQGVRAPASHTLPTYSFERTSYWTRPEASVYVGGPAPAADPQPEPQLLHRLQAKPDARLTVYCLPYAGGNAAAFGSWARLAPDWLDLVAIELPGGGEPAADAEWLAELAAAIRADAGGRPVAFCGLSCGAAVCLDLITGPLADWARSGRITAVSVAGRAVIGSAAVAADCPVESYLMVPPELRDDPHWQASVLPALHRDLALDARCEQRIRERRVRSGGALLDCPLQVHAAEDDPSFPVETAPDWAQLTGSPIVELHRHAGGHDFLLHRREQLFEQLVGFLDRLQPEQVGSGGGWDGRLHQVRWLPVTPLRAGAADQPIGWLDLDATGVAAGVRFLREQLTGADRTVAMTSRLADDRGPVEHCERFRGLFAEIVAAELRGRVILVLPAAPASGLLAGLTRTAVLEEPGLTVQRVFLTDWPAAPVDGWLPALLDRVRCHPDEPDLLLRGGFTLGRRLLPVSLPDLPAGLLGGPGTDGSAAFLVTGGTGGLGRIVLDWLIHTQRVAPQRVIVTGRTAPAELPQGVRFLPLDLGAPLDPTALAEQTGPLAGILHLAGALDDGMLRNLTAGRFPPVLAPKLAVAGLRELGRLTGAGWLIAFSSTSALLGAAGQANYAAANGWLDASADWATGPGQPLLMSVNWGTWAGVGMAAGPRALELARSAGETPLTSGAGLRLLGQVIGSALAGGPGGTLAGCQLDWSRSAWGDTALVSELPPPTAGTVARTEPAGTGPTSAVPADGERAEGDRVQQFLRNYVHRWEESRRLAELGLDSLDFARMRGDFASQFGRDVPLAEIARPNQRLAELHALLAGYQSEQDAPAARDPEPEQDSERQTGLSYAGG